MTFDGNKDRQELGAKPLPVHRLLGQDRLHAIPLFQRPYVWTRKNQWEPFWTDVREVAESILEKRPKAHFFGAVVFKMEDFPTGGIEVREVIDGQQRLCTLLVLVKAVRDACIERGLTEVAQELEKMLFNDAARCRKDDDRFKVLPNNVDREPFLAIMQADGANALQGELGGGGQGKQLFEAYQFFTEGVTTWLDACGAAMVESRLWALKTAIQDRVRIVVIDLEPEDDPQTIFESLNARGTPLLASDLVKNHLFHKAKTEGSDLERLYRDNWKLLDEDPTYWRADVGRGHAKRPRIDLFLQHFTTAKLSEEVVVEDLYRLQEQGSEEKARGLTKQIRRANHTSGDCSTF